MRRLWLWLRSRGGLRWTPDGHVFPMMTCPHPYCRRLARRWRMSA